MKTYDKIDTLFNRDKETFRVIEGSFRRPEFGIINSWVVTEKIDGQNIRLHWQRSSFQPELIGDPILHGRSDNVNLNSELVQVLTDLTKEIEFEVHAVMNEHVLQSYTLFGEGYGPGIQRGGGRYRSTKGFILFDVLINDENWLSPAQTQDTARRLGLTHVPTLGDDWSTEEIVYLVKSGFASDAAEEFDDTFKAEGIIAKPTTPLYNARGQRVLFKLKERDFVGGKMS